MVINIGINILLIIFIIVCLKNRKLIILLPYLSMIFFTGIYNILDEYIFVKVFGCGCVPSIQSNMFNINFNANDLRHWIYALLTILIICFSVLISKKIKKSYFKIIYIITSVCLNCFLAFEICKLYYWK